MLMLKCCRIRFWRELLTSAVRSQHCQIEEQKKKMMNIYDSCSMFWLSHHEICMTLWSDWSLWSCHFFSFNITWLLLSAESHEQFRHCFLHESSDKRQIISSTHFITAIFAHWICSEFSSYRDFLNNQCSVTWKLWFWTASQEEKHENWAWISDYKWSLKSEMYFCNTKSVK